MHELFVFEGRVEHSSPDVGPDEIREAIELLRANLPGLIENAVAWLDKHGIAVAAA